MKEMRFDEQVAIITGAGRGLGREYALALASRGAKIVVNNRDGTIPGEDPSASVVAEIRAAGGEAIVDHRDASEPASGDAMVAAALEAWGRVDIVVANAGVVSEYLGFSETTSEMVARMLDIHVLGTHRLLRAAWPHLIDQDYGRVITTSSASGLYGQPLAVDYSAAKGAIIGLTRALAHETAGTGIRVNLLSPGGFTRVNESLVIPETQGAPTSLPEARPRRPGRAVAGSRHLSVQRSPVQRWRRPYGASGNRGKRRLLDGRANA